MSTSELATLRLEHTFAATPEEVFDAWTNAEVLQRWWGPGPSWTSPGCDLDLRVGGSYELRMRDGATGEIHAVGGEYREVVRPHRLVYTWRWQGDDGPNPGHVSLVTVEFHAAGEATTVVLEHSGLPSQESRRRHGDGWRGSFANLAERIFGDGAADR
ncbi:MAG TPA: SRPBCC domain-containing protein [Solirubrobacteraceae bacterium]|nr:SRPBCC domain-containing protein [Solirubrobacteraceae bacterium]